MNYSVIIVDDHPLFSRGLSQLIETQNDFKVIGIAKDRAEALSLLDSKKPDLVIATGDIAFPVPYSAGTFNNYSGIKAFGNLMESLGVYWTVTFGNHDAECYSYFELSIICWGGKPPLNAQML